MRRYGAEVNRLGLAVAIALMLALFGCGGDSYSAKDRQRAEDFCGSAGHFDWGRGMGIDKYENPDGFDRCVSDAVKVADCLDTPAKSGVEAWVPESCDKDGYN